MRVIEVASFGGPEVLAVTEAPDPVPGAGEALVAAPDAVSSTDAAALLHDGTTAYGLLDLVLVRPGDRVLVTAAVGGLGALHAVGRFAPDAVVDYTAPDWSDRVRAVTGGVHVVFDGAGGGYGRAALDLLLDGGRFSAHGTPAGEFATPDAEVARARGITVVGIADLRFPPDVARRHLRAALDAAAAGRITPLIGQTFPLEGAADAHRALEQRRAVGKALLTL